MNRSNRMTLTLSWFLGMVCIASSAVGADENRDEIVIGFRETITSSVLEEDRTLEIYLPDNFAESAEPYPVLVVLDGDWYFRYVISIVDMMSPNHMPRMIVVGLPNTDRRRDLDAIAGTGDDRASGSDRFLRFLSDELVPHLEKKYRALSYRVLTGHSLAGYFTLYAMLQAPENFDAFIASSPSLRSPDRLEFLREAIKEVDSEALAGRYLFFSAGGNEGADLHANHRLLAGLLEKKYGELEVRYKVFTGEGHVPTKGFYEGIRGLFPTWIPPLEVLQSGSVTDIKRHYQNLTQIYGFSVLPTQDIIDAVARRMLREEKLEGAAEVYEYFVSVYPNSAYGYLQLADVRVELGQPEAAAASAARALELDPDNPTAIDLLEKLSQ